MFIKVDVERVVSSLEALLAPLPKRTLKKLLDMRREDLARLIDSFLLFDLTAAPGTGKQVLRASICRPLQWHAALGAVDGGR